MHYKEIMVFIVGTTPQIVTETIQALVNREDSICPHEVIILTTEKGKAIVRKKLFDSGRFAVLLKELGIKEPETRVELIRGSGDLILDDIRKEEDNEALGNYIVESIRRLTADETTRLHCSLAGGRKTMSFYLGSALSLFGRPWDKLYHVLVTPEFESLPDFYWKPEDNKTIKIQTPDGEVRILETDDAEIFLAELPFIRFREKFSFEGRSFKDIVREGQQELAAASVQLPIKIDLTERTVKIGSKIIEMVPLQLALYSVFLTEKLNKCKYPDRALCLDCVDCYSCLADMSSTDYLDEIAKYYKKIYGAKSSRPEELMSKWPEGIDLPTLRQNISKINRTIREHLSDETLYAICKISSVGKYGNKKYGVRVEKGKVGIIED